MMFFLVMIICNTRAPACVEATIPVPFTTEVACNNAGAINIRKGVGNIDGPQARNEGLLMPIGFMCLERPEK
jgi:hypothetical protein